MYAQSWLALAFAEIMGRTKGVGVPPAIKLRNFQGIAINELERLVLPVYVLVINNKLLLFRAPPETKRELRDTIGHVGSLEV